MHPPFKGLSQMSQVPHGQMDPQIKLLTAGLITALMVLFFFHLYLLKMKKTLQVQKHTSKIKLPLTWVTFKCGNIALMDSVFEAKKWISSVGW